MKYSGLEMQTPDTELGHSVFFMTCWLDKIIAIKIAIIMYEEKAFEKTSWTSF